jgi:SAM-dependent methyltransferase
MFRGEFMCHLCGTSQVQPMLLEKQGAVSYHIIYCSACDLVQTAEQLDAVSPAYRNLDEGDINEGRLWCQGKHKMKAFRQWHNLMGKFQKSSLGATRLLDVGCGTGGFLHFARECGFELYGYDASQAQANYARKDLPNVRKALRPTEYLNSLSQDNLKFHVVTLWDVLEHIRTPLDLLSQLRLILDEKGLLFASVPNGRAIRWKQWIGYLRGKAPELIPWEHVFYFSPHSLRVCLERTGFQVLEIGSVECYPRTLSLFELGRRLGFMALRFVPGLSPQIYAIAKPTVI